MLSLYRPQIIERSFVNENGQQFKLFFCVDIVEGKYKAKLISVIPIIDTLKKKSSVECLPISCVRKLSSTLYINPFILISYPYFQVSSLLKIQPTRAPNL